MEKKLCPEIRLTKSRFEVNFAPLEEIDRNPRSNLLWKRLQGGIKEYVESIHVPNLIKAGRLEEAARFYEKRGMYETAGKLRAKEREIVVKNTEVKVDLNSLLKQVAEGGIVALYRCPHCGGKLKIGKESTIAGLRTCEHCGSEIGTVDLAEFLKEILT